MADVYQDMQKAGMAILHRQTRWGKIVSRFQASPIARFPGDSLTPSTASRGEEEHQVVIPAEALENTSSILLPTFPSLKK